MRRYLVKQYHMAQVALDYIVDAEDEEGALYRIVNEKLASFRIEISDDSFKASPIETQFREIEDDGETTPEFWDCECDTDYIRSKTVPICDTCGATSEEQPDSRLYELPHIAEHLIHAQNWCENCNCYHAGAYLDFHDGKEESN